MTGVADSSSRLRHAAAESSRIERRILRFHRELSEDPQHRYRSWGHCYRHFRRRDLRRARTDIDSSSLQLAFYLASWGMYRGSSFLLWKDYRIHCPVVREILQPKHDVLLAFRPGSTARTRDLVLHLLDLAGTISNAYRDQVTLLKGRPGAVDVTNTLVTKVLLGTLACIPAYDAYVVAGLRSEGIPYSSLKEGTLNALFDWYRERRRMFDAIQGAMRGEGLRYPPIKLVDMYLWETGRALKAQLSRRVTGPASTPDPPRGALV